MPIAEEDEVLPEEAAGRFGVVLLAAVSRVSTMSWTEGFSGSSVAKFCGDEAPSGVACPSLFGGSAAGRDMSMVGAITSFGSGPSPDSGSWVGARNRSRRRPTTFWKTLIALAIGLGNPLVLRQGPEECSKLPEASVNPGPTGFFATVSSVKVPGRTIHRRK